MQISQFNNFLGILFGSNFLYVFNQKSIHNILLAHFGKTTYKLWEERYDKSVSNLVGYQETLAQMLNNEESPLFHKDFGVLEEKYNKIVEKYVVYSRYKEKSIVGNFLTRHFNVLCFLSGFLCLFLLFLGSLMLSITDPSRLNFILNRLYENSFIWLFSIFFLFLLDIPLINSILTWIFIRIINWFTFIINIFRKEKKIKKINKLGWGIGYTICVFFVIFIILNMHFEIVHIEMFTFFIKDDKLNSDKVILFTIIISGLHFVLYFLRGFISSITRQIKISLGVFSIEKDLLIFEKKDMKSFSDHHRWNNDKNKQIIPS